MSTVRRWTPAPAPADVEPSRDLARVHLLGVGLVGIDQDDLVTATLRTVRDARGREGRLRRRRWAA